MKTLQLLYFKALLQAALVGKTGVTFQQFFVDCAKRLWGSDFETIRPYGNLGDRKCDGRISREGRFFQCYGPYGAAEKKVHEKITEDFEGALKEWGIEIKHWTFVINDREGLDAASDKKVQELKKAHPHITFDVIGPHELEELLFSAEPRVLASIFGVSLEDIDPRKWELSFGDIEAVITGLSLLAPAVGIQEINNPPQNKIEINNFGPDIKAILKASTVNSEQIEKYFRSVSDVNLESKAAETFSSIYSALRTSGFDSNTIFYKLLDAVGIVAMDHKKRHAGFALVTYFFSGCVIFESEAA